jgi:hypothetical protein
MDDCIEYAEKTSCLSKPVRSSMIYSVIVMTRVPVLFSFYLCFPGAGAGVEANFFLLK